MTGIPAHFAQSVADAPAFGGAAVTPNDGADLAFAARSFWVGGAGNVQLTLLDDTVLTFVGATAGSILPVAAKRVWATGTTATNLLALF